MKEILIITSYYPPETGAASNRIFHLAEGLQKRGFKTSVVTPLPNYPTGKIFEAYKGAFKHFSTEKNIHIFRLWVFASNSKNKLLRLLAMLSYSISLICFFVTNKIPKTVVIQSPPLLVAFTSILCLKNKNRKLILNVSDLWPMAGLELGAFKKNFSYGLLEKIEWFNYKNAQLVLGQSQEILTHVMSIYPNKNTFLYRNYPDFETSDLKDTYNSSGTIKIVYAGLLGIAQGIFKLCQELNYTTIEFHIYGEGSERKLIETFILEHPELPVVYHGELSRVVLHKVLLQYDVAIIPLLHRIYGSVPSKIFEYSKLGLPILYFGGGEGETIVKKHQLGWIAAAGNYKKLNETIIKITASEINRESREKIKKHAFKMFDLDKQLNTLIENI